MAKLPGPWREAAVVAGGFTLLTIIVTWPLAVQIGSLARIDNADGQFAIWNVAWVARTLVRDPLNVFDANIFHPNTGTLAYSEANLGAGFLAIPVYWTTGNPYAAMNFVIIFAFILNGTAAYFLFRHLTRDWRASFVAATGFAFTPYLFGHLPHIQLLFTAGLPLSLLAFHRLEEQPTVARGCALGLAMSAQAYFCAYYAVFATLMIAYAVLVAAAVRGWRRPAYWRAVAVGALVAVSATLPLLIPFARHQFDTSFTRSLADGARFSATWQTYLASPAYLHRWMLPLIGKWGELLFPGFVVSLCGAIGVIVAWREWPRARAATYSSLALLAFWASLGPAAGLYAVLYTVTPGFGFLRAPSRLGVLVTLFLCAFAAAFLARARHRSRFPLFATSGLLVIVLAESWVPNSFRTVPPFPRVYRLLATLPDGPVLELPVYSRPLSFLRARYMLNSTVHWKPLIDAYSDYTPLDFEANRDALAQFPSPEAFSALRPLGARYVVVNLDALGAYRDDVLRRLQQYGPYLRQLLADDRTLLYEIVGYPP